jgi:hypothetical protein
MPPRAASLAALLLLALTACSRGADAEARRRLLATEPTPEARPAAPDLANPAALLSLDADEAARRLGSLDWSGTVTTTVTRQGDSAAQVHLVEHHRVRQLATGEFEVQAVIDDGQGPGGETGKHVIWAGGMAYARGQWAPWRQRTSDRGLEARRWRDQSFALAGELARLYGPALSLVPAGEASRLGRTGRRYLASLAPAAPAAPAAADGRDFGAGGADEDTRRHLAFLDGRVPVGLSGELVLDAQTGVPLLVRLAGAFGVRDDPRVRVQVEVACEIRVLGAGVEGVTAPAGARPDTRRPPGVAAALEAAGMKSREKKNEAAEPGDEAETPER